MPNTNLENSKVNMKTRIRNRVQAGQTPRDLGRLAKSARFVGLTDDAEIETDIDTQMAAAIPTASIDDLVEMSEGLKELRTGAADMGRVSTADNVTEGGNKFLKAANVQPALSVSGDLSYDSGVVSYTAPTSSALQVVATVGDLPTGASAGDQAVVQSNNKLYIRTADGWYAVALINTAPTVSGNDAEYTLATDGTPTVITLTAVDPENDPVTFSHSVSSGDLNGTTVDQADNVFTVTPHASNPATFELTFSADDTVNVATVVSNFTLAFSLSFDYTNTSPSYYIYESSGQNQDELGSAVEASWTGNILVSGIRNEKTNGGYQGDSQLIAWDVSDPSNPVELWRRSSHHSTYRMIFSHDKNRVSSNYISMPHSASFVIIRRLSDGAEVQKIWTPLNTNPSTAEFSLDETKVYVSYSNMSNNNGRGPGYVGEYELSTGNLLGTFDYPGGYTSYPSGGNQLSYGGVAVGEGGWIAISALYDSADDNGPQSASEQYGRIYIFDQTTRNHIGTINSPNTSQNKIKFGSDITQAVGNKLVTRSQKEGSATAKVYIYDLSDPTNPVLQHTIEDPFGNYDFAYRGDVRGNYAVMHSDNNNNRGFAVINLTTGQVEYTRPNVGFGNRYALLENGTIAVGDMLSGSSGHSSESYSYGWPNFHGRIVLYPANT